MSGGALTEVSAILIVLLVGFLPTEVWRWMSVVAGQRLDAGSEVFVWVRAVATALLAAVIARLLLVPAGLLADIPLTVRLGSVGLGVAAFVLFRRSVFAGVVAGEAALAASAWWFGYL